MQQITTPRGLETMLQAEHAVAFINFPWSKYSGKSKEAVTRWLKQPMGHPVFEVIPDDHAFTWQWLDSIFGDAAEEARTRGTVVWLRKGSVAALLPDAFRAGAKALARVTNDCFVLGKTHTPASVASLQSEPAEFDAELLKILCCPETHQALALADAAVLDKLNERFVAGRLQNRGGQPVQEKIEDGLVRADRRYLYPMRRNIPILLVDEAIPLGG